MSRTPDHGESDQTSLVTVVMPVRNEEKHIQRTLAQLLDQKRDRISLEVVVVDGRSTDRTREMVDQVCEQHPEVRLLDNPRRLSSAARNVGIKNSSGDYILIVDGHCEIPSRSYLVDLVDAFKRSGADCLGRPQPLEASNATPMQQAVAVARSSWLGHHPSSFIYSEIQQEVPADSVAVAYRRDVFLKLGLFDERFDACEDGEFNHRVDRASMRCIFDPRLRVNYTPRDTMRGLFRQLYRYGRGRVRLAKKHPATFSWKSFLPAVFVLGLGIGPAAGYWIPALWWPYLITVCAYLATLIAVSLRCTQSSRKTSILFWLPLVFGTIHFGAALGSLRELVHPFKPQREPDDWQAALTVLCRKAAR